MVCWLLFRRHVLDLVCGDGTTLHLGSEYDSNKMDWSGGADADLKKEVEA